MHLSGMSPVNLFCKVPQLTTPAVTQYLLYDMSLVKNYDAVDEIEEGEDGEEDNIDDNEEVKDETDEE